MKVSHFNTFPYGGAATAATRIHQQLGEAGVESKFYFHRNEKNVATGRGFEQVQFKPPKQGFFRGAVQRRQQKRKQREVYRQFNEHLAARPNGVETFSMAELPNSTQLNWPAINADVVHLHWISFFADYPSFFQSIPDAVPLVWTLHDMNAFTGGCHYSNDCQQYKFGCGDCPQVIKPGINDVSRHSFAAKQKALQNKQIHVVTPSQWLGDLAQKSTIWPKSTTFQTIKLGFDLKQFHAVEKQSARKQLGIDSNAVLVGFGAEDVNNKRKGIQHLVGALRQLNSSSCVEVKIEGLLFGSGEIADRSGLPRLHQMGYIDSVEKQRLIYSAADIVVVPSREDNQPQVGLEAMACGTPVVGFRAGGIPEYVLEGKTGLLAELGNESQLAERISWLANHPLERAKLGRQARLIMEVQFELGRQTQKYVALYESAIAQNRISRAA